MTNEQILAVFEGASQDQIDAILAMHAADVQAKDELIDQLRADMQAMQERDAARQRNAALQNRFDKAVGGRKFVHELVRKSVMEAFFAMALDENNIGRSDVEMLAEITRDQGVYAERYPLMMGPVGEIETEDLNRLTDAEYYAAFRGMTL